MPLALVRRVITRLAEHVPDGRHICGQTLHPRHIRIVEHAVVRCLQAGEEHGPRRGAHDCAGVVVLEGNAGALQALVTRQRETLRPFGKIALLVAEDEHNVETLLRSTSRFWTELWLGGCGVWRC